MIKKTQFTQIYSKKREGKNQYSKSAQKFKWENDLKKYTFKSMPINNQFME